MLSNKYHGNYWNVYANKCHYGAVNIHVPASKTATGASKLATSGGLGSVAPRTYSPLRRMIQLHAQKYLCFAYPSQNYNTLYGGADTGIYVCSPLATKSHCTNRVFVGRTLTGPSSFRKDNASTTIARTVQCCLLTTVLAAGRPTSDRLVQFL